MAQWAWSPASAINCIILPRLACGMRHRWKRELLTSKADRLVGGDNAVLVIDDTALPKKGSHSVGVAAQYASALGKTDQALPDAGVTATLASGEVPVMVGMRLAFYRRVGRVILFRMARARVPARSTRPSVANLRSPSMRSDRVRTHAGVRFGCVLADAGYGLSAPFRHELSERGLKWAVGIPRHQKVYRGDVALIFPVAGRGRHRRRLHPRQQDRSQRRSNAPLAASWRSGSTLAPRHERSAVGTLVDPPCACGSLTRPPQRMVATWVASICPGTKPG